MLYDILVKEGINFENGKIVIPKTIKKIKFDIGIAIEAVHTEDWLNKESDDLLVFGFEALPYCIDETKKYFSQPISKWNNNTIINTSWLNNQFIIVPVALGNKSNETVDFYVTNTNIGCSSLLKPSNVLEMKGVTLENIISVPIFKLSDFFELLPLDSIEYIEYIKVDVQGMDLEVIKSGGEYISDKVVFVTMEEETTQYENALDNNLENMVDYMNSIGFSRINHTNCSDATFLNRKFQHLADSIYISQFN
jgi:FkbM family methyltransferase